MTRGWEFWIDRGGTFTDVIGAAPDGRLVLRKVPSTVGGPDPGIGAARAILAEAGANGDVATSFKVGTTVVTNALLERRGSRVLLVITRGFGDALRIGTQARPDIFALHVRRPDPLFAGVFEVDERIGADGQVLGRPDADVIGPALATARAEGFDAVAIVLMHAWQHSAHEQQIAALARAAGFPVVVASHQSLALPRFIARGDSAVFEAYLAATLRRYVDALAGEALRLAPAARVDFMQSSGGLASPERFRAPVSVLSGPAGGLIGMARLGAEAGLRRLIGFDMGGTSTDVSVFDGAFERRFEHEIAGARLHAPMLDVHTIAAGGGSVLRHADGRAQVGPESAGAEPGPACYGRGGPATLTDVQVALGRLAPDRMPRVFGPGRDAPVSPEASLSALTSLDPSRAAEQVAADYLAVAVASMANAIRHVSVRQGVDPADFTLVSFGGAAGQHACRVAEACGIRRVLVHPLASVLSAFGIGVADRIEVARRGVGLPLDAAGWIIASTTAAQLRAQATSALASPEPRCDTLFELREGHSETTLDVTGDSPEVLRSGFAAEHERRFGYRPDVARLHVAAVRVEARAAGAEGHPQWRPEPQIAAASGRARAWFDTWMDVPVVSAATLSAPLEGPALVVEPHSTFVLEPGWRIVPVGNGALCAEHGAEGAASGAPGRPRPAVNEPAQLEIFDGLFMHVATQMGEVLRRTAQSVNIKERLDFSCAVFDSTGGLVANAPHMPVHLGSMGASVRAVIDLRGGHIARGDAWLVNGPGCGGTHLPDVTLVSPVFVGTGAAPDFFVASRAHHADIGGVTPGSMPPFSRSLGEEGILFDGFRLLDAGRLREAELLAKLAEGPWPARDPERNLADLRAQLAANARGAAELRRAAGEHGRERFAEAMRAVQDNAESCVRAALRALGDRDARCELALDGGPRVVVGVRVDAATGRARIDFTGTSPAGAHNFNAPRAVAVAAVLYVLRTLVSRPIPLNEGCLRPVELVIPPGSLLDPPAGAAVVAGNVETSQVVVDALYRALGLLAASQGTMNNLTFGNDALQYYETIAGGSGAGNGFEGCAAVQTHMTNSRLTDPEILESRFPVQVVEFAIRRGSGGTGRQRGGDGARRRLRFLAPMQAAILANRRSTHPPGLAGGGAGQPGITRIHRRDGSVETLGACAAFDVHPGDELEILTPGGGGWGQDASGEDGTVSPAGSG
jgi:5-oxoprolinase (ATP-hydrolysing)